MKNKKRDIPKKKGKVATKKATTTKKKVSVKKKAVKKKAAPMLWSVGATDAMQFDGEQWTRVE